MGDAGDPALGLPATSLWSLATPLADPAKSSQVINHVQAARRRNLGLVSAEMTAQGGGGVLGAVQAAFLQERHHVVREKVKRTGQCGRLEGEAVAGAFDGPLLYEVGELLGCAGELQAAWQAGELIGELAEGLSGLLGAAYDVVRAAGAVRGRDRLRAERAVRVDQRRVEPGVVREVAPPELRIDRVLQRGPGRPGLGFGAAEHEGHAGQHEDVVRVASMAGGGRPDLIAETLAGRDVGLRGEDQVSRLAGQFHPWPRRTRLGERGTALR